jgi:hypothetical protein
MTKSKLHLTVSNLLCILRILTRISESNKPKVVEGGLRRPRKTDRLWFGLACQGRIRDSSLPIRSLQGIMEFGVPNLCFSRILQFQTFQRLKGYRVFHLNVLET